MTVKELIAWSQQRQEEADASVEALVSQKKVIESENDKQTLDAIENLISFNNGLSQAYWNIIQVLEVNNIE